MYKQLIITLMLLISSLSYAQKSSEMELWLKMYPLVSCPTLALEYIPLEDGKYKVRIKQKMLGNEVKYYFESELNDLNDLSSITDYIVSAESDYCPSSDLTIHAESNNQSCTVYTEKYTEDYVNLVKDITKVVSKDRNVTCDNVLPFIKLQAEIEQLSNEDLLKFKNTKNVGQRFLRLLVDNETDEMIDHYDSCGGRKGSEKFIRNMILIEARNACIAPNPPGVMSWEDAEAIATKIGNQYSKKSLLALNSKIGSITKDAIMEFADKLTTDMVSDLIGPYMDPAKGTSEEQVNGFINNLESYKNLKNTSTKDITNYVSYVYSVDASIEVGKKSIPYLVSSNFEDKLPASWSKERKKDFLENVLIVKSQETYDSCMSDEKKYANYDLEDSDVISSKRKSRQADDDILKSRMNLKDKFCKEHPDKCTGEICSSSANILSPSDEATDTERVQGCVLKGLTLSIKPLLTSIIKDQRSEFIESFNLTDEMVNTFSKKTWDTLVRCVNRKIAKKNSLDEVDFLNEDIHLQKISTTDFENHLLKCSDIAENKVTKEFVSQLLLNQETLKDAFNSGENITDEFGNEHNKELVNITKEITSTSFTPCLEKQYELIQGTQKHGLDKKNSLLCTPLVEMNASLLVVQKKLQDMAKEKGLEENSEVKLIISEYESCGETAIDNALLDIGSNTSLTPINSVDDSKHYLNKNNSLFNCVENAISNISFVIAGTEYEKIAKEQESKVQNPKYLLSLKSNVQITVKECFKDGLNNLNYYGYVTKDKTGNEIYQSIAADNIEIASDKTKSNNPTSLVKEGKWSAFTSFNEDDGLDKLQEKCELLAAQEVIPKLIVKEAGSQLLPMVKTGFLKSNTEVGNLLAQEAYSIREKYNIRLPESINKSEIINYSLSEGLRVHVEKGGNTDSYIEEIGKGVENRTIKNVHTNLVTEIQKKTWGINNKAKYSELGKWFSPQCLLDINNLLSKDTKNDDSNPITMDNLAEYLQVGLDYSLARSGVKYYDDLKILKAQCDNMGQFKTTASFNSSKFYEIIIKGQIYQTFKTQFKEQIDGQVKDLRSEAKNPNLGIKLKYIDKLQKDMDKVFKEKLNEAQFERMMFSDNKLLSYTQKNLDGLLNDDPKVKKELTEILLSNTFKSTKDGSFGSDFAKAQIISSIGLSGIDDSVNKANNKATWMQIGSWRFGPNNYAKSSVKDLLGDPAKVEKELDWKNISNYQKSIYINTISHGAVIGATRNEDYKEGTKSSLLNMYSQEYLKNYPVPQDTNPTYFNSMAESSANMRWQLDMTSMKKQLASYTSIHGYSDFNDQLEKIVNAKVNTMNLSSGKESNNLFTYGAISRPNKNEVRKMLAAELRSYITESNVIGGLDNYKYSHGKSFSEKMESDITSRTTKKVFGNTAEQKKARKAYEQKRLEWKAQNPMWGPKF